MKFLDLNGLTHFWNKIKTFIGNNYLSLNGGKIKGRVDFLNKNDTTEYISVDSSSIYYSKYPPHYLFANGKMVPIGDPNGVASLDSEGNVPLRQLGNLDTTFAEVVTALPTTNIKKHIYLIKDTNGVTQDKYEEYIYTGDTSATYDASKWEKLGDFRATVDLVDYYTKSQVDNIANGKSSTSHTHSVIINGITKTIAASGGTAVNLGTYLTSHQSLAEYAKKIETVSLNEIRVDEKVLTTTPQGQILNQVILFSNFNGTIIEVAFKDATSNMSGFMSIRAENKLDTIAYGATADSAITTAEIDSLFA